MSMVVVLYSEINLLCVLILVLIGYKLRTGPYQGNEQRLLLLTLLTNMVFFTLDALWIFFDGGYFPAAYGWNRLLNCAYYIVSGLAGFTWFYYAESRQGSALVATRRKRLLCALPLLLLSLLSLASLSTGWLFYIDESNVYHRGPLYALQLLLSYGYVLFTAAKALLEARTCRNYARRRELLTLSSFVAPSLAAGAVQVFFPGLPLLCIGTTLGILYVYITLQEQLISVDPLTGLNNRNQMLKFLSGRLSRYASDRPLYLLMLDMDYFKQINDHYGHVEGDRALQLVAGALMETCRGEKHFISRYGGDEFIIICEAEPEEVLRLEDRIRAALARMRPQAGYVLSLSVGHAPYTPDMSGPQALIAAADRALYLAKAARRA